MRAEAQSAACMISLGLKPLNKAVEATAALADPGEAKIPDSESTWANHCWRTIREAALNWATIVTKKASLERRLLTQSKYALT